MINVPKFHFTTTLNSNVKLTDYQGMNIVLYFFPKDNTPGCSQEARDFRDSMPEFTQSNTVVFGVSRDSLDLHKVFKEKHATPFELISDREEKFCQHFGVIQKKVLYGITYEGLVRSTFLINAQGEVVREWRGIEDVTGHVAEVLEAVRKLEAKQNDYDVPEEVLYAAAIDRRRHAYLS